MAASKAKCNTYLVYGVAMPVKTSYSSFNLKNASPLQACGYKM